MTTTTPTLTQDIIQRLDKPGPRYTSYPTAADWTTDVGPNTFASHLAMIGESDEALSLYVHVPYCQSLCFYCGCNTSIRSQTGTVGDRFLAALEKEMDMVRKDMHHRKSLRQVHLGGGTPNFLNEEQLEQLYIILTRDFYLEEGAEISLEADPRTLRMTQLEELNRLGFNRISLGVQDFDINVQEAINRVQSIDLVESVTDAARNYDFNSINYDLIYGLPKQTVASFANTVAEVINLKPDRIAMYSFAHLPQLKKHQKLIKAEDLPDAQTKIEIFLTAREMLLDHGYDAIAMDHFALHHDELSRAYHKGELHRNFMGYTTQPTDHMIGLGPSAISDLGTGYFQNFKKPGDYYGAIETEGLATERGIVLTEDDQRRQWVINRLMCQFRVDKLEFENVFDVEFDTYFKTTQDHFTDCARQDLLVNDEDEITLTELGKLFPRNIAMGLDTYRSNGVGTFSRTV